MQYGTPAITDTLEITNKSRIEARFYRNKIILMQGACMTALLLSGGDMI